MPSDDPTLDALLADFADHLVPEAFATATRAHRVDLEAVDLRGLAADDRDAPRARSDDAGAWFSRWVNDRLTDAFEASWPHDRPMAVVFTSDGHLLRRYEECGCGQYDCASNLAAAEVRDIATPWVFAADLPRPLPSWEVVHDAEGRELDEVLVAPADHRWLLTWFAEARGRGVSETRAGILSMDGEVVVSTGRIPVRASPVARHFHRILFRHPARKHHPLGSGR